MKKNVILACLIAFVILFMSLAVSAEEKRYDIPIGNSPSIGPVTAPVTIIEFLDYQ